MSKSKQAHWGRGDREHRAAVATRDARRRVAREMEAFRISPRLAHFPAPPIRRCAQCGQTFMHSPEWARCAPCSGTIPMWAHLRRALPDDAA